MTHHLPSTTKPLLGKCFQSLIGGDPATVVFTDGTKVGVNVTGDCCSSSYIYDTIVEGSPAGTPLLGVIEHDTDSPQPDAEEAYQKVCPESKGESLSVWDIRFKFEGGSVLIRHINDSNGYYDGYTDYTITEAP